MQDQIADLRICTRRIQDYLTQEEVITGQIIHNPREKEEEESEYAVRINHQSFSWGLQTLDIDDMFDKMNREMKGLKEE